jgi:hypothetical protein
LVFLGMQENRAAIATGVIDSVSACHDRGRGVDDRSLCRSRYQRKRYPLVTGIHLQRLIETVGLSFTFENPAYVDTEWPVAISAELLMDLAAAIQTPAYL